MQNEQSHKFKMSPFRIIMLVLVFGAILYAITRFNGFNKMADILIHASWVWLFAAIIATVLTYLVGAIVQYIAGNYLGTIRDLIRLGFAGSFLNHFLPFSIGGIGLVAKYYQKLGQRKSQALVMATVPIAVGSVITFIMILIISPITLSEVTHSLRINFQPQITIPIVGIFLIIVVLAIFFFKNKIKEMLREAIDGLKGLRGYKQIIRISIVSILVTLTAAFALYASVQAIHGHLDFVAALTIFIASMLIGEITPTPGGIGTAEAVLILGLSGAGLAAPQAIAATLMFRFVTYLLPLVPGAIAVMRLKHPTHSPQEA
jgi:uncharacterized membrane protein YbhN (UPF0104 family)